MCFYVYKYIDKIILWYIILLKECSRLMSLMVKFILISKLSRIKFDNEINFRNNLFIIFIVDF